MALHDLVGEGEGGALRVVETVRILPVVKRGVLLVADADIAANSLVCGDFIRGFAQNAGPCNRQFANDRIELTLVANGAAEPTILFEIARRMRHHAKDIGAAILAEQFARAFAGGCGIAVVDTGHVVPSCSLLAESFLAASL